VPRFPALDPEPTRRQVWRRRAWPAAGAFGGCLLAGGIAAGVVLGASGSAAAPPGSRSSMSSAGSSAPGTGSGERVLVAVSSGLLESTSPQGGSSHAIAGAFGEAIEPHFGAQPPLAALSPDGRYLVAAGNLFQLAGHGRHFRVIGSVGEGDELGPTDYPWAFHGRLLTLGGDGSAPAPITLAARSGQVWETLGRGLDAAGDPTRQGALISVAKRPLGTPAGVKRQPVAGLELRAAGQKPTTLVTAQGLAKTLGLPKTAPYRLSGHFSPDGQLVAVEERQLGSKKAAYGLAVLTREGANVVSASSVGPAITMGTFSHSSEKFAYAVEPSAGKPGTIVVVDLADEDVPQRAVTAPKKIRRIGACVWSPGDSGLLCNAADASELVWLRVNAHSGHVGLVEPAPGVPLAWLPRGGS
jgi:hypothetical protein